MTIMKGNTPAKRRRGRSQRKFHSNFKHDDQIKNDDLSMTAAESGLQKTEIPKDYSNGTALLRTSR
uniref:Uncharacterized protein n=1 Tax=Arion vulgaris TaxID=1028688 RepID=A0A0B7B1C3_9EUPU